MAPTASDVVKTLRGLLNSSQNGLMEKQLMRDYREMEGHVIPYQQFGFRSLIQFLEASNEFDLTNTRDGVHIRAKLAKESLHVAQLVESQNRLKRKKNAKPMPPVPRARSFRNTDSNWNNPTQSQVCDYIFWNNFIQLVLYNLMEFTKRIIMVREFSELK